ncbi:hypothetical protein G6F46_004735 [Rhizopus delemar]|uniref:Yeast cell wall synthesis Kre9/Knh1-like N-terminal domain-containing protein n=3 Tax=Rhizopus TaxID=4842 RepID=I1BJT9_RHIO9|nr:hypothetical protein RO3G_01173 [Rhizopus delemar RA 99-880]KAG1461683.1 hypothetical protein G6F55_003423 [Rhizopus delemar]KAG1546342.1 hypothetical protein G6F51_004935 [Rhizopus arrhizus]KAG1499825.1 hypothetical protein G6F54_004141 [Rhizopus delemar]KAG1515286.1 hypothetical protein G6F53_003026 [Rhizopus delemar]|eukprot:EIE76469.1 hypothetical protein RO3G_01173 [Rhizopus delemar RA 99-880]
MKFSIVTLLSITISTVYAQTTATTASTAGIAVNKPSFGEVVTAGQPYTITWTVTNSNVKTINSIALVSGASTNLQTYISNILSSSISTSNNQYSWNVPSTIETGASYALALKGDNGQTTYSTYFTITGAAPGTSNSTSVTAAAASSGAVKTGALSSASASAPSSKTSQSSNAVSLGVGMMSVASVTIAFLFI